MRRITQFASLAVLALAAPVAHAQSSSDITGTVVTKLVSGEPAMSVALTAPDDAGRSVVSALVSPADDVKRGEANIGGKRPVYLIKTGDQYAVIVDLNRDGRFEASEKIALQPGKAPWAGEALLDVPAIDGAAYATFPVKFAVNKGGLLLVSYQAFADGVVLVDGTSVKVRLVASATTQTIDITKGYQYVDCNGDGTLDQDFTSWEMGYARGEPVVFHIGNGSRYVSIKGFDAKAGTLTLASRPAADYQRVELRMGGTLPDVSFKTLDGTPKKLSDFRGKYLLIDFWGTWCGPCVGEIPFIKKAYETYKSKGFEVLGMDNELPDVTADDFAKGLEKVKAFVEKEGVTWTQAQTESIKVWYDRRFQIVAWPTMILLDPKGTIISVDRTNKGEPGLRGEKLEQTLAAIFKDK